MQSALCSEDMDNNPAIGSLIFETLSAYVKRFAWRGAGTQGKILLDGTFAA
jgi:hypothetical protein